MATDIDDIRAKLRDLGQRIDAEVADNRRTGVLHGAEREAAAELQIRCASALRRAEAHSASLGETIAGEIAADVDILKHLFERWLARVDKASEGR